jgi:TRAP-type C4-dicarboxylate transport system permease small subunit
MACAILGGVLLIGMGLMTLSSVVGRALLSRPIEGDVEIVQLTCAVCLACFLPYTQWQNGNIVVDFFTSAAPRSLQRFLDALGSVLLGLVAALVCWRTSAGAMAAYASGESSMLIAIPIWIPYLLMTPGLLLTAVVSFFVAWRRLTGGAHE